MTIKEVVDILENERPHCGAKFRLANDKVCEAFDMAIRSLKAWGKVLDGIGNYIENKGESGIPHEIGQHDGAIDCYDFIVKHLSEVSGEVEDADN